MSSVQFSEAPKTPSGPSSGTHLAAEGVVGGKSGVGGGGRTSRRRSCEIRTVSGEGGEAVTRSETTRLLRMETAPTPLLKQLWAEGVPGGGRDGGDGGRGRDPYRRSVSFQEETTEVKPTWSPQQPRQFRAVAGTGFLNRPVTSKLVQESPRISRPNWDDGCAKEAGGADGTQKLDVGGGHPQALKTMMMRKCA